VTDAESTNRATVLTEVGGDVVERRARWWKSRVGEQIGQRQAAGEQPEKEQSAYGQQSIMSGCAAHSTSFSNDSKPRFALPHR
jgi:hypothetical protein